MQKFADIMSDTFSYEIRWAKKEEWKPAMLMIWKTFIKFEGADYTEEGIRNFYDFISDDGLYQMFLQGNYQLMVAVAAGRIIGAGSLRNCNYLSLLFVDEEYHRKGVGRALIKRLSDYLYTEMGENKMVLRAAPYAVDFYRRLGFQSVRGEEEYSGIRVTLMEKSIS